MEGSHSTHQQQDNDMTTNTPMDVTFEMFPGDEQEIPEDSMLFLDSAHGVYIPQLFCEQTKRECVADVSPEDWDTCLEGPDGDWYWEAWENIENNAIVTAPDTGIRYGVYQDGDVWLVPITE